MFAAPPGPAVAREIRDPVHGAIPVERDEELIIDHPAVQRLRRIHQLGFSHLPFPGATHTRFAHGLGALHLAGLAFDHGLRGYPFRDDRRRRALRACLRLAALCHDLGHAPYSHAAEFAMPPLRALGIDAYVPARVEGRLSARAHHEDYTVAILTRTPLAAAIGAAFPFTAAHVAALVHADVGVHDDFFVEDGVCLRGLLSQMVSSDLDVDRVDYLQRDAAFTGARYGAIDAHWLLSHLTRHTDESGQLCLALDRRALYAFDDFLVARQHMFLMVYFHQKSVAYEEMLKRVVKEHPAAVALPADAGAYLETDDAWLWTRLRQLDDPWARRITEHRPVKLAFEAHLPPDRCALPQKVAALAAAGVDALPATAHGGLLSRPSPARPALWCVSRDPRGRVTAAPMAEAMVGLHAAAEGVTLSRIYAPPEQISDALRLLEDVWQPRSLL